jgi:hypothetical protein
MGRESREEVPQAVVDLETGYLSCLDCGSVLLERQPFVFADDDEKHRFEFLDALRKSGVTNMWGAGPYLRQREPEMTLKESHAVLVRWTKTFNERGCPGRDLLNE